MKGSLLIISLSIGLALFLAVYGSGKTVPVLETSRKEIVLRKIGHELLRSAGDDTSRVLPVQKTGAGNFQIRFENELALSPDSIVNIINKSLAASTFPGNYTVNVVDCSGKESFYGYAMSTTGSENLLTCSGRTLPKGCYYIDLTFSDRKNAFLQPAYIFSGAAIAVSGLLAFIFYRKSKLPNEPQPHIPEENEPDQVVTDIAIGRYTFNGRQQFLELDGLKTVLTGKESKLLHIFASSINEVIDRNTLQKEVWENEGVIVTRSLDMFVSKLRKKLQGDSAVKIVNFPGKGYMLEVID